MIQKRMHDVLWIEDESRTDTARYIPPVKQTFQYRLSIARDLSEAVQFLIEEKKQYDAVIVDMRLPIGTDKRLQKIAPHTPGYARIDHKHGIELLASISARIGSRFNFSDAGFTTSRELMSMMRSTSTRLLAFSVLPVDTRSTMASASPVSGASSMLP